MAVAPHYALFCSKTYNGSVHDYTIHKETSPTYLTYLTKTPTERGLLREEDQSWAILGDSAYIGMEIDTPGIRRVALPRHNSVTPSQTEPVQELKKHRVGVESFFGRCVNFSLSSFTPHTILTNTNIQTTEPMGVL